MKQLDQYRNPDIWHLRFRDFWGPVLHGIWLGLRSKDH